MNIVYNVITNRILFTTRVITPNIIMDNINEIVPQLTIQNVELQSKDSNDTNTRGSLAYNQLKLRRKPSQNSEVLQNKSDNSERNEGLHDEIVKHLLPLPLDKYPMSDSSESDFPGLGEVKDLFDVSSESDEDVGCPLPSTPEDENALVSEISEVLKAGVLTDDIDLTSLTQNPTHETGKFVMKVCESSWNLCHYSSLPDWMKDNDFVLTGYRPPLPSFYACFRSIFRLHTETANIWTHLLGCLAFMGMGLYFLTRSADVLLFGEKIVFSAFFLGAIICFGLSSAYHILHCHSECIGRLFSKLDYCGIALLIIGSFIPWLYYGFYCQFHLIIIYLSIVTCLGVMSIIVSLWDRFSEPRFRPLRAGLFLAFGLSGVIPAIHYAVAEGWLNAISQASLHWLALMGSLYVLGALFYALRVPERFFPGMCDIWFQSHQIFHVLVIAAAFVHYHAITEMAMNRMLLTECTKS